MLAMKIISVSMRYGSPRQALVITLCIRPCTESGYSQENPLSMRTGAPSSSTNRSSGAPGQPSASPASGVFGCTRLRARSASWPAGGMARGNGALWRKPPGRSMVPSRLIRMASARIVWKPFECAARPRMAWNATGLPVTVSCSVAPAVGPGDRQLDLLVARGDAHLVREAPDGRRRDAGDALGPFGRVLPARAPRAAGTRACTRVPSGSRNSPNRYGSAPSRVREHRAVGMPVPPQLVLRVVRYPVSATPRRAREQAVARRARIA